jgi:hypothetical protein
VGRHEAPADKQFVPGQLHRFRHGLARFVQVG